MKFRLVAGLMFLIFFLVFLSGCTQPSSSVCPPKGFPQPPGCGEAVELPQIPAESLPAEQEPVPVKEAPISEASEVPVITEEKEPELIEAEFLVTVPYWTQGDVFIGVEGNPMLLKLNKIDEVLFSGKTEMAIGTDYFYSLGSIESAEIPVERTITQKIITQNRFFDGVIDWQNSKKEISVKGFHKSFYINACHSCSVSITKGNFIEPMKQAMDEIKALGGNWIDLVPVWFIEPDYKGNNLRPIYSEEFKGSTGWVSSTIKDDDLKTLIDEAHKRDLKVYLCPHLAPENWGPDIKGKGHIMPSNPDKFFENYKNFLNHYAELAEETKAEMLCVGNELDTLTQEDISTTPYFDKTSKWREVIKSAREKYNGLLTYSVACIDERRCGPELIKFWDALDVIGWEWYTPIAKSEEDSITEMKQNAERIVDTKMKDLSEKFNKPIALTEIGWEAYKGACTKTYGVSSGKGGDRIEQTRCTEAVLQAIEDKDFIKGMHVWSYTASLPNDLLSYIWTDSTNEVNLSITEKEFFKWFNKIESD